MATVTKRKSSNPEEKVKLNIDVDMCVVLVQYSLSKYPSNIHLANLRNLLNVIDIESYVYNYDIYNRLILVKHILTARLDKELSTMTLIKNYVASTDITVKELIDNVNWDYNALSVGDARAVNEYVDDKMKYYFFELAMPKIIEKWHDCQKTGFDTDTRALQELNDEMTELVTKMQSTTIATGLLRRFRFSSPDVADVLKYIVKKAHKPTSILQTGIRQLNAILGPGFRSGKLYVFLGLSGKFKSGTLLNIADQIRQFNPQVEDVINGKRNTILFITMENDIEETIERVFSMYAPSDSNLINASFDEVYDVIINRGGYTYTDTKGIDIDIRFFHNLEITTHSIYSIVDEMEREGEHCIAIILDYIKRIESTLSCHGDEILRASYVAKELKNIAEYYQIPVITAQQINRTGNQTVDAAMKEGKQDLIRFIGNSDIGGAWSVIEEADWVCIVSLERQLSTGRLFLSFKRTKQRAGARSTEAFASDYFNHPFSPESEMRLQTDLDKEASVSIVSIASDIESVDQDKQKSTIISTNNGMTAQTRPTFRKTDTNVSKEDIMSRIKPIAMLNAS
jgi:hypothetical protein